MRLFDIALVPILCGGCGEPIDADSGADRPNGLPRNIQNDDGTCTSCWVNPYCPAGCNDAHDAPSFREANGSEWECPATGQVYWYHGPNLLAERHCGQWLDYESVLVRCRVRGGGLARRWIDRDDACWCESCDAYIHSDYYAGDDLCQSCYDERDDYYDDDEGRGGEEIGDATATRCANGQTARCLSVATHWHPITERVSCAPCSTTDPGFEPIPALAA